MRNSIRAAVCFLVAIAFPAYGAIVDRTAITVGTKVITESEIIRRIRLTAFRNGVLPDFGPVARREAAQRLIELKLVEHEMDLGHYARTSPEQTKALVDAYTADHYRSSPEALRLALGSASLTPEDLQTELAEQDDLLSFLNLRFRPAVEISDQEIEKYFHEEVEAKNPGTPVTLSDVRANITQILTAERADKDLDLWLKEQRARTRINYLMKDLQ